MAFAIYEKNFFPFLSFFSNFRLKTFTIRTSTMTKEGSASHSPQGSARLPIIPVSGINRRRPVFLPYPPEMCPLNCALPRSNKLNSDHFFVQGDRTSKRPLGPNVGSDFVVQLNPRIGSPDTTRR